MLTHVQYYRKELIKYLFSINSNIDWDDFINTYMTVEPRKLLHKIKSLIWIDKDLSYDNGMQRNKQLFSYYTNLLNKYYPILRNECVYILDVNGGNNATVNSNVDGNSNDVVNSNVDQFIINEIKVKINVLVRLLSIMTIKYKLISSSALSQTNMSEIKILIPTGSITYSNPNAILDSFSGIMIVDNYFNIYNNEMDIELNFFKLSIYQLSKNTDITTESIINQKYGFLKFTSNN